MAKKARPKRLRPQRWDATEEQAFRDGCRRRASTIQSAKKVLAKRACRDRSSWEL